MDNFLIMFGAWVLTLALYLYSYWSRSRLRTQVRALKRVAQSRFVVYRNPDGGNGPKGMRIVDDTFESLYLLAKYGGMEANDDHAYSLQSAYGTMTIAIDMPKDTDGGHL